MHLVATNNVLKIRVSQLALTASLTQPRVMPWKGGSKGGIAQIGM